MTRGEIVGTAPALEPNESSPARGKWDREELELALGAASGHIRFLLRELSQAPEGAGRALARKAGRVCAGVASVKLSRQGSIGAVVGARGREVLFAPSRLSRRRDGDRRR